LIEFLNAKTGERVLRWRGRLMASRLDPSAEAAAWFTQRTTFVAKVRSIFILGAGAGFHIREAARQTAADIVVIERNPELIEAASSLVADFDGRVRFIHIQTARELRSHIEVRTAVSASFVVLEHPASLSLEHDFYRDCSAQLLGRDWGGLNWQWALRGVPALDSNPRIDASEKPLSIYDLEQTELVQDSEERERMLLKALRELVK
jgi:hypothetical protein